MIIVKSHTFPGMRQGFQCVGKCNTNASGVGTITFTGKDVSSKITGIVLVPLDASDNIINCNVTSVAYSAGVTTITFKAQKNTGEIFTVDQLRDTIVSALTTIVTNAPTDTAELLTEITTAAATITALTFTATAPTSVAFDGDVYYSFWVNDDTLPTDQTTNNPGTENL